MLHCIIHMCSCKWRMRRTKWMADQAGESTRGRVLTTLILLSSAGTTKPPGAHPSQGYRGGGAGTCLLKQASQGGAEGGGGGLRDATGEGCGALFRPEDMARYVVVVQLVVPW
jgi:hypothetical protein